MDVRTAAEKLRDYETVIDTMHCGLVAEDLDSKLVFVNQQLLEWTGYQRNELLGQHVDVLVPQELRELLAEDIKANADGDLRARLLALRRKDSTTFPVITIPQNFHDHTGALEGYFSIVVDMGAVLTAKPVGPGPGVDLRASLGRIAMELHSISLCVCGATGAVPAVAFDTVPLADLSPREQEVLVLLMAGARVPAIAERLHISQHTVRNHLKSMFRKLEVGTQSELIEKVRGLSAGPVEGDE